MSRMLTGRGHGPAVRRTALATAVAMTAVLVAGCSDTEDAYCETMAEEQRTLTTLAEDSANGSDVLVPTLESFQRLQDAAPEELQDEWATLTTAYEALVEAVERAGVDPADYDPEKPPKDLSAAEADRLAAVASKLASSRVREAAEGIQDHALDVCEVEFGG